MIIVNNTRMSIRQMATQYSYELIGAISAVPVAIMAHPVVSVILTVLLSIVTGAAGAFGAHLMKKVIKYYQTTNGKRETKSN